MDAVAGAVHHQPGAHHRGLGPARHADAGKLRSTSVRRPQDELPGRRVELGGGAQRQVAVGVPDLGDQEDALAVAALQLVHDPREIRRTQLPRVGRGDDGAETQDMVVDDRHVERRVRERRTGAERGQPVAVVEQLPRRRQHRRQPAQLLVRQVIAARPLRRRGRADRTEGIGQEPRLRCPQGICRWRRAGGRRG
ncbi:hypothetical protein ACWV95_29450 [Streptomyces albus]